MPVKDFSKIVSLNEGGTGFHHSRRLSKKLGIRQLHVKNEGENPTGSFKDRGMTVGVTKAVELGVKSVICASTGNTSASLAAYAARAGLQCTVLIPAGKIAYGKLSQAMIYGAKVIQVQGNFDESLDIVLKLSEKYKSIYLLNSINPFRIEGQKSLGFEICDQLGKSPDYHFIPVGNAGNITAYWKGYKEYQARGRTGSLPRMMGFQAEGAAPIVRGRTIANPETIATAIRIGPPLLP